VRAILLALCVIVAIFLQISFLPALRPFGVVPDILLPVVVFVGLYGQASTALIVAVAGGLSLDIASSADFGLWTGLFVLAALACGYVHRAGVEFVTAVAVLIVIMGTFVVSAVSLAGVFGAAGPWSAVTYSLVLQLILNTICTILIGPVIKGIIGTSSPEMFVG
jgi:rod shape-determining protein MreD